MCKYIELGYTIQIGLRKYDCKFIKNKNCGECVNISKIKFDRVVDLLKVGKLNHNIEREFNMNNKKLIYKDSVMHSEYCFLDNVIFITHNDNEDDGEKNTVCVEIDNLRRIILDYDLNYGDND